MDKPEKRLFDEDVNSASYRAGVAKDLWDLAGADVLADQPDWPKRIFWMAAAQRPQMPQRFYVELDFTGYRSVPPTGTFWDPDKKTVMAFDKRPKGKADSRFAKVFRTDWESGKALHHPYDGLAAKGHPDWIAAQPHLVWTQDHTVVDWLEEFQSLLNCGDYIGV